jgi:uncharacterized protein (UPF0335 family)
LSVSVIDVGKGRKTLRDVSPPASTGKRILRNAQEAHMSVTDNEIPDSYKVTAGELRQFIEQMERLDIEKKDIAEQQKEIMAEAKARGYDTKVIRKVIALRKRDADDIAEEEAVLEMYKEALGM